MIRRAGEILREYIRELEKASDVFFDKGGVSVAMAPPSFSRTRAREPAVGHCYLVR